MPARGNARARRQGITRQKVEKGSLNSSTDKDTQVNKEQSNTQRDEKRQHPMEDTVLSQQGTPKFASRASQDAPWAALEADGEEPSTESSAAMALEGCSPYEAETTTSFVQNEGDAGSETKGWRGPPGKCSASVSVAQATAEAGVAGGAPVLAATEPLSPVARGVPGAGPGQYSGSRIENNSPVQGDCGQWIGKPARGSNSAVSTPAAEVAGMDSSSARAHPAGTSDCPYGTSSNVVPTPPTGSYAAWIPEGESGGHVSVVSAAPEAPPKPQQMPTSRIWIVVFSVLLTWVQDPLLSLLASTAAARMQKGASLAVVGVGAGGQAPDGVCLLLVALGLALGTLCSRSGAGPHKRRLSSAGRANAHEHNAETSPALDAALRVAAVGAWLAAGVGIALASCLYTGSETVLSFFLSIKGGAAASAEDQVQQQALALAVAFVKLRCLSLPCSVVTLTAKAALLTFRDTTPQLTTLAAAATAAPLFFIFSARAGAAATPEEAAASFAYAAGWTVVTVQVAVALLLLVRLGILAAADAEQKQQQGQSSFLQSVQVACRLYRPPLYEEIRAFAPFVLPVLTQCCVRMVLYSSMTKAASLWGPKAMAAHQLVSGLYTVLGMPADTMAQVVNAAMPKSTAATPTGLRRMQRRIFKVSACTAAISAAVHLSIVAFLTCRLADTDLEVSRAVLFTGGCASIPLLFLPFASAMEGLLLRDLRGSTVAAAYAATLPAPLLVMLAAESGASEMRSAYLRTDTPAFVCCLWVLPLLYNLVKLGVMGFRAPRAGNRLALFAKESPV